MHGIPFSVHNWFVHSLTLGKLMSCHNFVDCFMEHVSRSTVTPWGCFCNRESIQTERMPWESPRLASQLNLAWGKVLRFWLSLVLMSISQMGRVKLPFPLQLIWGKHVAFQYFCKTMRLIRQTTNHCGMQSPLERTKLQKCSSKPALTWTRWSRVKVACHMLRTSKTPTLSTSGMNTSTCSHQSQTWLQKEEWVFVRWFFVTQQRRWHSNNTTTMLCSRKETEWIRWSQPVALFRSLGVEKKPRLQSALLFSWPHEHDKNFCIFVLSKQCLFWRAHVFFPFRNVLKCHFWFLIFIKNGSQFFMKEVRKRSKRISKFALEPQPQANENPLPLSGAKSFVLGVWSIALLLFFLVCPVWFLRLKVRTLCRSSNWICVQKCTVRTGFIHGQHKDHCSPIGSSWRLVLMLLSLPWVGAVYRSSWGGGECLVKCQSPLFVFHKQIKYSWNSSLYQTRSLSILFFFSFLSGRFQSRLSIKMGKRQVILCSVETRQNAQRKSTFFANDSESMHTHSPFLAKYPLGGLCLVSNKLSHKIRLHNIAILDNKSCRPWLQNRSWLTRAVPLCCEGGRLVFCGNRTHRRTKNFRKCRQHCTHERERHHAWQKRNSMCMGAWASRFGQAVPSYSIMGFYFSRQAGTHFWTPHFRTFWRWR